MMMTINTLGQSFNSDLLLNDLSSSLLRVSRSHRACIITQNPRLLKPCLKRHRANALIGGKLAGRKALLKLDTNVSETKRI